jgi:hypothetical protein
MCRARRPACVAIHTAGDAAETMSFPAVEDPAYTMLHYESPNGDQFVRKWRALLESGGSVGQRMVRRRFGGEVKRLLVLDLPAEETAARLEHLYQEHVADDVETLRRLGLLHHHDPDSWAHDPETIPSSETRRVGRGRGTDAPRTEVGLHAALAPRRPTGTHAREERARLTWSVAHEHKRPVGPSSEQQTSSEVIGFFDSALLRR